MRLATVEQRLGVGDRWQALSAWTAARFRKVPRACIRRAVELEVIPVVPWPPAPKGRPATGDENRWIAGIRGGVARTSFRE